MLGKTAGGLFWMCRYLERCENTARLIEAGFRMSLTRTTAGENEWGSVLATAGCDVTYEERHGEEVVPEKVIDFLLRDKSNPLSVINAITRARENARMTRTALTLELWEAVNESWMLIRDSVKTPVSNAQLLDFLAMVRQQTALVRGCLYGTLLRNDIYNFCQTGLLIERADNTARILDVKYYVLLPFGSSFGSPVDNVQWEMLLRSASAERSFHWLHEGETTPANIASFLMLDPQMPRSLAYCYEHIVRYLTQLEACYDGKRLNCQERAVEINQRLANRTIEEVLNYGLHEYIGGFLTANSNLANQIESDYRFVE